MSATTRNGRAGSAAGREVLKLTSRIVRRTVAERVPRPHVPDLLGRLRIPEGQPIAQRVRSLPIQCSIDIAVPLRLAYDEWMRLDFLPEGAHRVCEIERDGHSLTGSIATLRGETDWSAEIREQRPDESFAWRSTSGSDCAGLITFHALSERLTRLELQLDVVPTGAEEAAELLLHVADRRAEADLRRFKARLETISPDDYPAATDAAEPQTQSDDKEE